MAEPARLPLGPMALGHPKISILAWETAKKTPPGFEPMDIAQKTYRAACFSTKFLLNQSELAGVDI